MLQTLPDQLLLLFNIINLSIIKSSLVIFKEIHVSMILFAPYLIVWCYKPHIYIDNTDDDY